MIRFLFLVAFVVILLLLGGMYLFETKDIEISINNGNKVLDFELADFLLTTVGIMYAILTAVIAFVFYKFEDRIDSRIGIAARKFVKENGKYQYEINKDEVENIVKKSIDQKFNKTVIEQLKKILNSSDKNSSNESDDSENES